MPITSNCIKSLSKYAPGIFVDFFLLNHPRTKQPPLAINSVPHKFFLKQMRQNIVPDLTHTYRTIPEEFTLITMSYLM
ncbi:hypothetical protein D3C71_1545820 [compost metagenome]